MCISTCKYFQGRYGYLVMMKFISILGSGHYEIFEYMGKRDTPKVNNLTIVQLWKIEEVFKDE